MGLFTQDLELRVENELNIIEKKEIDLKKGNVNFKVVNDYVAIIGTEKLLGGKAYKYSKKAFGDSIIAFVYQNGKNFDNISINFTTGEYTVSLDTLENAKAKYCLNGTLTAEIFNYEKLAKYFNRTVTRDDIVEELQNTVRDSFATEVRAVASKYITANSTANSVYLDFDNIKKEIAKRDISAINKLLQMGLDLSSSGIALKLTPVDETETLVDRVNNKINQNALDALDDIKDDKLRSQRLEEKEMDQKHEINKIRAEHTTITENYGNISPNENNEEKKEAVKYCSNCGAKLKLDVNFCPVCGKRVD